MANFDFIISQDGQPVGRVSANPSLYTIQFDLSILEKDKADSRGGKIDIQVKFTDHTHWESQITVTNQRCNTEKPDDPENGRIAVVRKGDIWTGQSMFYNGIGAAYNTTKTCSTLASDSTGLVFYTDFVSDRSAAKAAIYIMKRTENSTAQIGNFGFNRYCANYPDLCQTLATALGTNTSAVNTHLNQLTNPFCFRRGSAEITWNSSCQNLSGPVANESFLANANWMTPFDFYRLAIKIPDHL